MEVVLSYAVVWGRVGSFCRPSRIGGGPEPSYFAVAGLGILAVLLAGRRKFRQA